LRRFFLLCLAAVLATIVLHSSQKPSSLDQDAQNAARRMLTCLQELKAMRQEVAAEMESVRNDFSMFSDTDFTLNPALDPALSGLIGVEYTDLTTTLGDLRAKQTSLHPQFAALVVMWLKAAGVKPGDMAAISFSGSFPALNLAVLCACDELQLHPVIFSSVGASAYGANIPGFTWLDMEARLYEKQLIGGRTRYASLGGILDMDGGIGETGIRLGEAAIAGHGAEYVHEGTSRNVITDIERRLELYTQEGPPAVFISVGGNVTSLGWVAESALLGNGLLLPPGTGDSAFEGATRWIPETDSPQRGIIFRMFEVGTPVLHLLNIERLAAANNLPMAPVELSIDHDLHLAWRNREISLAILFFLWLLSGGLCLVGQCRPLESADDD
jgi:poly-gamma-glutamate system protein